MLAYCLRRLAMVIPTLAGISVLVFLMIYLVPGDPAQIMLGERADGATVDARTRKGATPLHGATGPVGHVEVVKVLLDKGADPNTNMTHSIYRATPIHHAAQYGEVDVLKVLFARGGNPNVKTKQGQTPLRWAMRNGHKAAAEVIRQHGGR